MLPSVKVDTGAIKHIINGADVMAPGLTSPNAFIPNDLKADIFVVRICSFMYLIG
jgi:predicted RNA-binding protein (TIGR00451 family)